MLTVDFERLGLRAGERLLDLGCGAGRHAFAALERGAVVTAVDADDTEVKGVAAMFEALGGGGSALTGDALRLPFPDGAFHRVIAAEVLEHIPADTTAIGELVRVLRPGGTIAVTVPRWGPELLNWALSDEYHSNEGGHIRIYRRSVLEDRLRAAGVRVTGHHHAHALHSPYWWLKCAVGVNDDEHRLVKAYHRMLVWDITSAPAVTRLAERALNPVMGKSVVVYGVKEWR
ncbi:MAG TPA: methyltransferase domain-containing protein [Acidimicrobiales bacterium]|jgi:SAM-dependent methyltransferase